MFIYLFRSPETLSLLFLLCTLAFIFGLWIAIREIRVRRSKRIPGAWWVFIRWAFLLPIVVGLITASFAEPIRFSKDVLSEDLHGRIALLLDDSFSMQAGNDGDISYSLARELQRRDIFPTRLALCKETIREAFRNVSGLEIIIITFTGAMNLRVGDWMPLHRKGKSREQLDYLFESIQPEWMGSGTDLSRVFVEIRELFGREPDIALLCSDGGKGGSIVGDEGVIIYVKKFSHQDEKEIPVFVLGAGGGTNGSVPIPILDPEDGRVLGHARDARSGQEITTEFFPELLARIAEESGGEYVRIERLDDGHNLLQLAVLKSIRQGEIEVESAESLAHWFVIPAFIFALFLADGLAWIRALFSRNK